LEAEPEAQTASDLKKDHPFRYIQGFRRKTRLDTLLQMIPKNITITNSNGNIINGQNRR
jgi:hypothetical protein